MVQRTIKSLFKLALTICFVLSYFCWAGEQKPQYDNLSFGIPGEADTIIDRPGYASVTLNTTNNRHGAFT